MSKGHRERLKWFREHRLAWGLVLVAALCVFRAAWMWVFRQWFGPFDFYETPAFALFLLAWFSLFSLGLVGGGIFWLTGTSWRALGWRRTDLAKAIGLGLLGFLLSAAALLPLMWVGGVTGRPDYVRPSAVRVLLVTFFAFGIAAWTEENLFRGYLQPLLARRLPLWAAVMIQAALFTAAHLGYATELLRFVWLFVSGLIFGWLRGRDRSLVAPYLAHALGWTVMAFGPPAF